MSNTGKWLAMQNHQSNVYPREHASNGSLPSSFQRLPAQQTSQPRKRKASAITERNNIMMKKPKLSENNNATKLRAAMQACRGILTKLLSRSLKAIAWPFYYPVDAAAQGLWNYHDIIKKPMDLGTITEKISTGAYETPLQFAEDVRLIFANCYCYNPPDHEIVAMGRALEKIFETEFSKITPAPVKCVNNLNNSTGSSRKSSSSSDSDSDDESSAKESSDSDSDSNERSINVDSTRNNYYNNPSDSEGDVDVKSAEFVEAQNHFKQCEMKLGQIVETRRINRQRHQQNLNDLNNNKNKAKKKRDSAEESAKLLEAQHHLYQGTMKLTKYLDNQQIKRYRKVNNSKKAVNSKKTVSSTVATNCEKKNPVPKMTPKAAPRCTSAPAHSTSNNKFSLSDRQILAHVTSQLPEDELGKVARVIYSMEPSKCKMSPSEDLEVDFTIITVSTLKYLKSHFVANFPVLYAEAEKTIMKKNRKNQCL